MATISKAWSTGNSTNEVISVFDFGAKGNGTTNDSAAIALAVTEAGPTGEIYFPAGTYLFSANISLSCYVRFDGAAILKPNSPSEIATFLTPDHIHAANTQKIFTGLTTSTQVVFLDQGTSHAGWWGMSSAETDRSVNTAALENAILSTLLKGGKIIMPGGLLKINPSTITMTAHRLTFSLEGLHSSFSGQSDTIETGTTLDCTTHTGSQVGLLIQNTTGGSNFSYGVTVKHVNFAGPGGTLGAENVASPQSLTVGLKLVNCPRSVLEDVHTHQFYTGIRGTFTFSSTLTKCSGNACHYGMFFDESQNHTKLIDPFAEESWIGIAVADAAGGFVVDNPILESCKSTGLYVNPKDGGVIDSFHLKTSYFEANLGTLVEVGTSLSEGAGRWTTNGSISFFRWTGTYFNSVSNFPIFKNITGLTLDVPATYAQNFSIDSSVDWTIVSPHTTFLGTSGASNVVMDFLSSFHDIEATGPHTLTLPPLAVAMTLTPYTILRHDALSHKVLIDADGTELIAGVQSISLDGENSTITLWVNRTTPDQWRISAGSLAGMTPFTSTLVGSGGRLAVNVPVTGARLGDLCLPSLDVDILDLTITATCTVSDVVTVVFNNNTGAGVTPGSGNLRVKVFKG